jgi:hypothetical protein
MTQILSSSLESIYLYLEGIPLTVVTIDPYPNDEVQLEDTFM